VSGTGCCVTHWQCQTTDRSSEYWLKQVNIIVYPMHWISYISSFVHLCLCEQIGCQMITSAILLSIFSKFWMLITSKPIVCGTCTYSVYQWSDSLGEAVTLCLVTIKYAVSDRQDSSWLPTIIVSKNRPWYSHIFVLKRDIKHQLTNWLLAKKSDFLS